MIGSPKRLLGKIRRRILAKQYAPSLEIEKFGNLELAYRMGTSDHFLISSYLDERWFDKLLPWYRPEPDHVVIDVGAHIGAFALAAALRTPGGHVHAIEACRESYCLLRVNALLNPQAHVSAYRIALSDRRGECKLFYDTDGWGHSTISDFAGKGEVVPMLSLEDFLNENGIARCDLLKLNCEGAEFPILLGSSAAVLNRMRFIYVHLHEDLDSRFSAPQLISHLTSSGFEVHMLDKNGTRSQFIARNMAS